MIVVQDVVQNRVQDNAEKGAKTPRQIPPPPGRRRDPDLLQIIGAIITDRIETQTKKSSDRKAVSELSVVL